MHRFYLLTVQPTLFGGVYAATLSSGYAATPSGIHAVALSGGVIQRPFSS